MCKVTLMEERGPRIIIAIRQTYIAPYYVGHYYEHVDIALT